LCSPCFFLCSCSIISIGHTYPHTLVKLVLFHQSVGVTFCEIKWQFHYWSY
jgi:hypothetical protein